MLEQIRKRMDELGWTQAELARAMNVPPQRVWDILNRGRVPSSATLERLAMALGCDIVLEPKEGGE
jgi:transcriptional regulator with XRE-family HTH domain